MKGASPWQTGLAANLQICTPCDKKGSVPISTRADIGQISARYESEKADNEHRT